MSENNTDFGDKQTFLIELFFWNLEREESFQVRKGTRIRRANVRNVWWMIESHIICSQYTSPVWWGVSTADTFHAPKNYTTDNERTSHVADVLVSLNIILNHYEVFALYFHCFVSALFKCRNKLNLECRRGSLYPSVYDYNYVYLTSELYVHIVAGIVTWRKGEEQNWSERSVVQ